jgi:dethiobiotin synthetase
VILVAANRLGVLNHTLLSLEALQRRNATNVKIALVNGGTNDASIASNQADLRELAKPISVYSIGFAANYRPEASFVRQHHDPNLRGLLL